LHDFDLIIDLQVCIFAYGQTGSGKSWTMEGGSTPETAGMIPRAIEMMFRETDALKDRGWEYKLQGQFLEIYNETVGSS
jgi:kinesin family protein C1